MPLVQVSVSCADARLGNIKKPLNNIAIDRNSVSTDLSCTGINLFIEDFPPYYEPSTHTYNILRLKNIDQIKTQPSYYNILSKILEGTTNNRSNFCL